MPLGILLTNSGLALAAKQTGTALYRHSSKEGKKTADAVYLRTLPGQEGIFQIA